MSKGSRKAEEVRKTKGVEESSGDKWKQASKEGSDRNREAFHPTTQLSIHSSTQLLIHPSTLPAIAPNDWVLPEVRVELESSILRN